jgi:hypothetical protein
MGRLAICLSYEYKKSADRKRLGGTRMSMSTRKRVKIVGFFTVLTVSSAIMLWSFWHYPVGTGIATAAVLLGFGILVRLARAIDTEAPPPAQGEQSA